MSKSGVNLTYAGLPWRTRAKIRLRDWIFETAWRHGTVVLSRELYEKSHRNRDQRENSLREQLRGLHGRHKELREQLHKANLRRMELEGVLLQVSDLLRDAGVFPRIKSILRGSKANLAPTTDKGEAVAPGAIAMDREEASALRRGRAEQSGASSCGQSPVAARVCDCARFAVRREHRFRHLTIRRDVGFPTSRVSDLSNINTSTSDQ